MSFKVGDKVVCVDFKGFDSIFKKDEIYTVRRFSKPNPDEIILEEVPGYSWRTIRFKPAYLTVFNNKLKEILDE